jgi:hypothetical protein
MNNRARIKLLWLTRETREGWPLLTVENEVDGDSKSTNERGPSLVSSLSSFFRVGTRDFYPGLAALVGPVKYIFFPHKFMCPHRPATWARSRAGPPVSECVSPWLTFQKWHTRGQDTWNMYNFYCEKGNPQSIPHDVNCLQYFQKNWGFGFLHAGQWRLCKIFPTWLIFFKEINIVRDTVYICLEKILWEGYLRQRVTIYQFQRWEQDEVYEWAQIYSSCRVGSGRVYWWGRFFMYTSPQISHPIKHRHRNWKYIVFHGFFRDLVNISGSIFLQEGVFLSIYIFFSFLISQFKNLPSPNHSAKKWHAHT